MINALEVVLLAAILGTVIFTIRFCLTNYRTRKQ